MKSLKAEGVKTVFGYPGGAIMPVYDALYDYAQGEHKAFEHILVRHEQAATHAAEGYARVSGEVGVCIVTSGPGATNTLTGVADAMMDSTPMVVIAGQVSVAALGTDAFQEVDLVGVAQPISKWSYQIRRAEDVAWAVSRAFYIARSGRPGPVVLDFAKNAQVATTAYEECHVDFVRSYMPYPPLNEEKVRLAADIINQAKKEGRRVIAVGTTSVRLLESAADDNGILHPFCGETDIFITPGYKFKILDMIITNFHLPKSTLFMLICAIAGTERMKAAYAHAIAEKYRFYSYGDSSILKCINKI